MTALQGWLVFLTLTSKNEEPGLVPSSSPGRVDAVLPNYAKLESGYSLKQCTS